MKTDAIQLYLASQSPRRRELLDQIGIRYQVINPDIPEHVGEGESPEEYVIRVALEKARAGRAMLPADERLPVLGSDTAVVVDHQILGKPIDRDDGLNMLRRLSGRRHQVLTAMALVGDEEISRLSVSHVTFRKLSDDDIEAYWSSGEPADKAGGYAIQGMAAAFIERLEGSYSGVMGLSLFETVEMLKKVNIRLFN